MALVHYGPGYSMGLVLYGPGTQWDWYTILKCFTIITFIVSSWMTWSQSFYYKLFFFPWESKQKKIWNRVDCQRSEKKIRNTQEIKRTLLTGRKRTKRTNYSKTKLTFSFISAASFQTKECMWFNWKETLMIRAETLDTVICSSKGEMVCSAG